MCVEEEEVHLERCPTSIRFIDRVTRCFPTSCGSMDHSSEDAVLARCLSAYRLIALELGTPACDMIPQPDFLLSTMPEYPLDRNES